MPSSCDLTPALPEPANPHSSPPVMQSSLPCSLSLVALALLAGCNTDSRSAKTTFLDVHEFGPGKVNAAAVAEAHRADLAVEAKHGVRFIDYWVDERAGIVYCLSEAPAAHNVVDTHREAHGLLPARVLTVTGGEPAIPAGNRKLFIDVHEFTPGSVKAKDVAEAHRKDLAAQERFGVNFLNYWVDESTGTVICLSEAPDAEAVRETHRNAHGLLPVRIEEVTGAR